MFDLFKSVAIKSDHALMEAAFDIAHAMGKITRPQFNEFLALMFNRTVVGECRYEAGNHLYFDRDQEETIGKDWRLGYAFLDWKPELFARAGRRKLDAYVQSGNQELLVDVANYYVFEAITSDKPFQRSLLAAVLAEWGTPIHPKAHYRPMDQDIDGTSASGSASVLPEVRAKLRSFAR